MNHQGWGGVKCAYGIQTACHDYCNRNTLGQKSRLPNDEWNVCRIKSSKRLVREDNPGLEVESHALQRFSVVAFQTNSEQSHEYNQQVISKAQQLQNKSGSPHINAQTSKLGRNKNILEHSHRQHRIQDQAKVGPTAYLR